MEKQKAGMGFYLGHGLNNGNTIFFDPKSKFNKNNLLFLGTLGNGVDSLQRGKQKWNGTESNRKQSD